VQLTPISRLRLPDWPWPFRYPLAVGFAASAILLRGVLTALWGYDLPFLTFFPAIVLSAWTGGFGPGVLATGLCGVAAQYFWLAPPESFAAPVTPVAPGWKDATQRASSASIICP